MLSIIQEGGDTILFNFITPFHSLWSQTLQTASGPDAEFLDENLAHPVLTYALFIVFIIAMPVLFNNFLVSTFCVCVYVCMYIGVPYRKMA